MSTCRWASYIGEPALCKIDEELVALPETEQVLRGQELMQMLAVAPVREEISSVPLAGEAKFDSGKAADFDWNVIVKKGFIEVVIPAEHLRKRSMSDSALPRFKSPETQWKSLMADIVDTSDASTNVSAEALDHHDASFGSLNSGDVSGSSDDGHAEAEVFAQPMVPYQYMETPWWSPMGYDTSANSLPCTGYGQESMGFTPARTGFEQEQMGYAMPSSTFMPTRWADQSIGDVDCAVPHRDAACQEWRTTVMIRNMPNNLTRDMFLELVNSLGLAGTYDFVYLPIDFQSQAGLGYAFINFCTVADAEQCFKVFEGFTNWRVPSEKVCTVTWSSPTQGLEQHVERYKNSPVMHQSLPDEWKPVLIQRGTRIQFPPPSKPIKTPKVRQHAARDQH